MPCKMCIERGRPAHYDSEPECAFESGEFSSENWNCATVNKIRCFIAYEPAQDKYNESRLMRKNDQTYVLLWIPPHPDDVPDGYKVGPWRGGGCIAMSWEKDRGQCQAMIRLDPRDGGTWDKAALPLTFGEAEAAIENVTLSRKRRE